MTDPMTPLTDESEAMLAEVHGTQMALTVFPARLRAIEQAAARRALEGSGVVEALAVGWVAYMHGYASTNTDPAVPYQHRGDWTECPWHPCRQAAAILAALPRPEEPRVERCAVMDDVTALRDRLLANITTWTIASPHWEEDAELLYGYIDHDLDRLIAAVEARAIEGSGVVEALVEATSLLPEDAPEPGPYPDMSAVWYERGWDDRGDAILASLPRPEEPRVERVRGTDNDCGRCGAPLRTIDPEYEPGGRVCDDCGWDSRDTHPDGEHDYQPGVCGMSCDFTPESR